MSNKKLLEDSEWLFTVLTALVKKEGGELKISDKDLLTVSKKDVIGLFYDKKDNCTILKLVNHAEIFGSALSPTIAEDLDN